MAGTEKTTMMAPWPSSQGRTAVNRMDIKDACILMTRVPVTDINETRANLANNMTEHFVGVPGLRSKDFTTLCENGKYFMVSFYLFTHKKYLQEFYDGDLWKKVKEMFPDIMHRSVDLLEGTEATAELGCYPQAPVWQNFRPT